MHFPENRRAARRMLVRFGSENVKQLLELQYADLAGHVFSEKDRAKFRRAVELLREAEEENACLKVTDLAVDGYDMIALGLKGAQIGRALSAILEAVVDERVPNRREELLKFAEKFSPCLTLTEGE